MVNPIPDGFHTITPSLTLEGAAEAIEFYKRAFGAEERSRALDPSGTKVWHAELRIGNSVFFVNDTAPEMGATPSFTSLWIYLPEADAAFDRAVKAGLVTPGAAGRICSLRFLALPKGFLLSKKRSFREYR